MINEYSVSLVILWILYFIIHSILASLPVKAALKEAIPSLHKSYRLLFNGLSILLLLPLLYLMYAVPSTPLWQWSGSLQIIANLLGILALLGFAWSLTFYDNMDFLGFSQLNKGSTTGIHEFTLSPLHRYVRHPWYSFALVLIWTQDMNLHFLISALCMTGYFVIGTLYEERKLVIEFGKVYQDYQRAVPCLIPSFRRFLSVKQAEALKRGEVS